MHRARWLMVWVGVLAAVSILLVSTAGAAQGKGRSGKSPGRQKGEKKGWKADVPPGTRKKCGWIPPGLNKEEQAEWKDGRPPGWSCGEKEGWKGADMPPGLAKKGGKLPPGLAKSIPPGWEKWSDRKKRGWEKELGRAKKRVRSRAKRRKGFSQQDVDSAVLSVEAAARKGVPIRHARGLVEGSIKKGTKGRGLESASRAMAYGVGREIDFEQLGKFVRKKLDEGRRGDELTIEIYKEVSRRHEERLKAREAIRKKKRK